MFVFCNLPEQRVVWVSCLLSHEYSRQTNPEHGIASPALQDRGRLSPDPRANSCTQTDKAPRDTKAATTWTWRDSKNIAHNHFLFSAFVCCFSLSYCNTLFRSISGTASPLSSAQKQLLAKPPALPAFGLRCGSCCCVCPSRLACWARFVGFWAWGRVWYSFYLPFKTSLPAY